MSRIIEIRGGVILYTNKFTQPFRRIRAFGSISGNPSLTFWGHWRRFNGIIRCMFIINAIEFHFFALRILIVLNVALALKNYDAHSDNDVEFKARSAMCGL